MIRIPYLREAGALLLLAGLSFAAWKAYDWAYDNGYNAANVRAEQIIGEMAKAEAAAQARARKAEQDAALRVAQAAEQYEQDKQNALAAKDRTIADLRAGRIELQDHWRGCATDRVSSDATSARLADEVAQLRRESSGRIVQIADEADAHVRGLQRVIEAYPDGTAE